MTKRRHHWPQAGEEAKARRVWHYRCKTHPDRKCRSHFMARALEGLCAECRAGAGTNPNQTSLIDMLPGTRKA